MLMLLCATVCVVVLSPYKDYAEALDEAIAELNVVAQINLDQFIKDSHTSLDALRDSNENMDFVKTCHFSIRNGLSEIGLKVLEWDFIGWGHYVNIGAFDAKQIERLKSNQIIEDYRRLIAKDLGVDLVWFDPYRVAEAFLEEFKDPNKIPCELLDYPVEASLSMNGPYYCPSETKNFCGVISLALMFKDPNWSKLQAEVNSPPASRVEKLTETGFQKWLNRHGLLKGIVKLKPSGTLDMPYTKELLFPNLRPFWTSVKNKTPEEAIRVLKEKAIKKVSLWGVGAELDVEMVVIAAPLLTAIIYLFFLSYAAHLKRTYDGTGEILREFSWLLLFPGVIHSIASWVLVLLPSLVLFLLIGQHWCIGGRTLILGSVFTVFSVILASYCLREINHLRKKASFSI
jgi:hypothetical protein